LAERAPAAADGAARVEAPGAAEAPSAPRVPAPRPIEIVLGERAAEPRGGGDDAARAPAVARADDVQAQVQLDQALARAGFGPGERRVEAASGGALDAAAPLRTDAERGPAVAAPADEAPFPQRIVRGLGAMVGQRGGVMSMRLHPPELGALRVEMSIIRGAVTANFTATTLEAHGLLERDLGHLRTALERHGLSVERIGVHLAPPESGGTNPRGADGGDQGSRHESRADHDAGRGESRGRRDPSGQDTSDRDERRAPADPREFAQRLGGRTRTGERSPRP
jgi:hypothetical protein